jgi:uncharacterized protein (TIGR04141 family)
MPKIKPTIYLIKNDVLNPEDIFKGKGMGLNSSRQGNHYLYTKTSSPKPPKWERFIKDQFEDVTSNFFNASSYAVIVIRTSDRFFAIPLGMGMHEIDQSKIEYNFGIKVAINTVEPNELKQVDLTTPESNSQKTKKQATKNSTPEEFGINKLKDILKGLVGRLPENHPLGESIQGKDNLRLTISIENLEQLEQVCIESLNYSKQEKYRDKYPWIDNLSIIGDPAKISTLYDCLIQSIKENDVENMHIAPPDFVDDLYGYDGFQFMGARIRDRVTRQFPTMQDWVEEMGEDFVYSLTQNHLKKTCRLILIHPENADNNLGWPMHRCITWEYSDGKSKYILSEGNWYEISPNFYSQIESFFNSFLVENTFLPSMPGNLVKEADYNYFVCQQDSKYKLFDLGHSTSRHKSIGSDQN